MRTGDGPAAIALDQNNNIDVAVLDVRLVGMSGIELLERLRNVNPRIDVVIMTAFESIDTMRQALRLGARDYCRPRERSSEPASSP